MLPCTLIDFISRYSAKVFLITMYISCESLVNWRNAFPCAYTRRSELLRREIPVNNSFHSRQPISICLILDDNSTEDINRGVSLFSFSLNKCVYLWYLFLFSECLLEYFSSKHFVYFLTNSKIQIFLANWNISFLLPALQYKKDYFKFYNVILMKR